MKYINIDWKPNKKSSVPIYRQIVEYITMKISKGDWSVGQKLPPQREMAKKFNVNRSTIVTAMEELISYDLIEGNSGRGTIIKNNTWSLLMSTPPNWEKYVAAGTFEENWDTVMVLNDLCSRPDYIDMGVSELPTDVFPKEIMNSLQDALSNTERTLNFMEPLGMEELRIEICKMLKKKSIVAEPENILITSGSLQAFHLISVGMLKKGDFIYSESPSYLLSLQVFESNGVEVDPVPIDDFGLSTRSLKSKQRSLKTKPHLLYTIPSFQSPTGITMSEERRKDLFKFCQNERLPIIEDDAYADLYFDNPPPPSLKSMDKSGMVLYTGTFSTVLASGLRLGFVVGSESVISRLADIKQQMDYGASSISQAIACYFLKEFDYEKYLKKLRAIIKGKKDLMVQELKNQMSEYVTWREPEGGFHMWVTYKEDIDMEQLFADALKEKIVIVPGYIYESGYNNSIRLTFSYSDPDEIIEGIKRLRIVTEKQL